MADEDQWQRPLRGCQEGSIGLHLEESLSSAHGGCEKLVLETKERGDPLLRRKALLGHFRQWRRQVAYAVPHEYLYRVVALVAYRP